MTAIRSARCARVRPALALLPLALSASLASAAPPLKLDPAAWLLCGPRSGFGWEAPLAAPEQAEGPIDLSADRFDVSGKDVYRLQGNVVIEQPARRLRADRLDYTHSSTAYAAEGSVRYQDPSLALQAERASGTLSADQSTLEQVDYRLIEARGNGRAEKIALNGEKAALSNLSYTTCNPGQTGWSMQAGALELDQASGEGVARNATLRVGSVPILWLPYATFPIDDRRRSGFLYPSLGYGDDTGIDVRVPYYWNIAPNVDATLTPRVLGRRGAMLGAELRFLSATQGGKLEGNWLPDDDLTGRDRGSLRYRHGGTFGEFWSLRSDLNHVSDDRYFEDFGDSLTARSTSLLESHAGLYGRGPGWTASLTARDYDVTDPLVSDAAEPYRQLPRVQLGIDRDLNPHLRYGASVDAVAFDHDESGLASFYSRGDAQRYDLQPFIELPFERAAGYIKPRLAYRYTSYQLSGDWLRSVDECEIFDCGFAPPQVYPNRSPSRATPVASLDAALNFDREASLFGRPMLQTLQPRLFYLRVPHENQDDIPLFDTQELTFGFDQLFRTNRFSGADRQGDANQLTLAVTSRWFEQADGRERLALSLGQIRYFDELRVGLPFTPSRDRGGSAYVAGADVALNDQWSLGYAHQYDPDIDHSTVSGFRAQWKNPSGALANLAYRYRRDELEQIDASFALPMGEAWRWVGRWNYSLQDESTLESFGGLEWQNCCLAFRVLGRHYVRNREGQKNNAVYFELELKGLASFGRDTGEFLQRAILGYSR